MKTTVSTVGSFLLPLPLFSADNVMRQNHVHLILDDASHREAFLKHLAARGREASWMNVWLEKGKLPPGHALLLLDPFEKEFRLANVRLQGGDLIQIRKRYFRPNLHPYER